MNIEEIRERHDVCQVGIDRGFYVGITEHYDRAWLLSEYSRLIQELESEKTVAEFSRKTLQTATDLIKSLKLEIAEERAACKIAGHAMDAMRATIERNDEEIRLLRDVAEADLIEHEGIGAEFDSLARRNLEAFDKEHHAKT